jgi:hypothetical protein
VAPAPGRVRERAAPGLRRPHRRSRPSSAADRLRAAAGRAAAPHLHRRGDGVT